MQTFADAKRFDVAYSDAVNRTLNSTDRSSTDRALYENPGVQRDGRLRAGFGLVRTPVHNSALLSEFTAPHKITQQAIVSNNSDVKRSETLPGDEATGFDPESLLKSAENGTRIGAGIGAAIGGVLGGIGGFFLGGVGGALIGAGLGAGLGGAAGGLIGNASSGPASPTLTLANDTYVDSVASSIKKIKFDAAIPAGSAATDYALVNHVKGTMKTGSGAFFKVKMYGSTVDFDFPSWQVDSVDPDPVYWSSSSSRWNYNIGSGGFSATDRPGPALSSEHGAVYAVNFRIGLYKLSEVPTTTSGTISAKPLVEKPWQYSVAVDSTGKFTHPPI